MKVQQYHKTKQSALKQIADWKKDFRSSWSKDYGEHTVAAIHKSKTGPYGDKNVMTPSGRFLYDIILQKKRKR